MRKYVLEKEQDYKDYLDEEQQKQDSAKKQTEELL
jgi:hypothetical protein